ncbi:MAG: hypothetical protein AAFR11_11475 [Pseudomonadota bacterium]
MSETQKRCVLHVGAGKTGSSAFQAVCETEREALAAGGVDYPQDPREGEVDRVTHTGNAVCLRNYLLNDKSESFSAQANKRLAWMQMAAAAAPVLVLSNEMLHKASVDRLRELRSYLKSLGRSVDIIFVVREPTSHAISVYSQLVRLHGLRQTFPEFIYGHKPPFFSSAERLTLAFGREAVRPVIYSAEPGETVAAVFDAARIDPPDLSAAVQVSNRSATAREIAVLRGLNALSDNPKVRQRIANTLIDDADAPARESGERVSLPSAVLDRFRADSHALSALLFNKDAPALEPLTTAPAWLMRAEEVDPTTQRALEAAVAGWTAAFAARPEPRLRRGVGSAVRMVGRRFGLVQ